MKSFLPTAAVSVACSAVLLLLPAAAGAQSYLATGADAQVTEEGLHRVEPTVMPAAWVRQDLDLSGYTKVFFLPTTVSYLEVDETRRVARLADTATNFPISESRQARLREQWAGAFHERVSELGSFELVDYVGRDVLLIRGQLVDVASGVPPDRPGSGTVTVLYPWEATIVLDIQDSMSDTLLARTVDRRRIEGPIDATAVEAGVGIMLSRWATLLTTRLEELAAL